MPSFIFRLSLPGAETGKSPVISIMRLSDRFLFDFDDNTFKSSGWGTVETVMVEIATELTAPPSSVDGEYYYEWAIPDVRGVVGYEALVHEDDTGERVRQQLWAVDGHEEHNSQILVTLDPTTVTPNSIDQVRLAILSLVMGDMENLSPTSAVFKSPNGQVLVTFDRAQAGGAWSRTRV